MVILMVIACSDEKRKKEIWKEREKERR